MESVIGFFKGTGLETTFWYIAIPTTILFCLIMLGSFFGLGEDIGETDTDFDDIDQLNTSNLLVHQI